MCMSLLDVTRQYLQTLSVTQPNVAATCKEYLQMRPKSLSRAHCCHCVRLCLCHKSSLGLTWLWHRFSIVLWFINTPTR